MASKRLVVALLVAANLLAGAAVFFFLRPCPIPSAEDDGDSAAGPCPDPLICLPFSFSRYAVHWIAFILGCLATRATGTVYKRFAGDDDQASTATSNKAGYVAIPDDDPQTGGADGNN